MNDTDKGYRRLIEIGTALSAERNFARLMEMILEEAKRITGADGGTLYLREGNYIRFAMMITESLKHYCFNVDECEANYGRLPIYDEVSGQPKTRNVATSAVIYGQTINIPDIYNETRYDFSGTREYDAQNNYRTISCLTVPLKNYENEVIGVIQLLNKQSGDLFDEDDVNILNIFDFQDFMYIN